MKWASVGDFLSMGGYGAYVWGSYAVTALVVVVEVVLVTHRYRAARAAAARGPEPLPERE
jgi:heme exporter protein D